MQSSCEADRAPAMPEALEDGVEEAVVLADVVLETGSGGAEELRSLSSPRRLPVPHTAGRRGLCHAHCLHAHSAGLGTVVPLHMAKGGSLTPPHCSLVVAGGGATVHLEERGQVLVSVVCC
jgi:hypothetical protein